MSDARLWLAGLVALPALVIGASFLRLDVERLRRLAVASAVAMLLAALVIAVSPRLRALSIRTSALSWAPGGEAIIRIDTLSAVLLPFAAGLWLLTVAVTPRAALDRGGLRRTALATLITLASFLTESAVVLLLLSVASVWTFLSALADPAHQYQRRIVAAYLGFSTLLFGVGVALLIGPGVQNTTIETAGMWLIVIAALVRKGIVPFHAWVPEVFDHGRLGPAILFSAPQVGAYMTVVLIVPRASPDMLRMIAILALGTAVYGAALALVQTSARRACGYLFMSQSALVMAGLDCTSVSALAGGLLVWLSAGLAFAGLARCVLVLEARRGRLDLTTYHGGYERMPLLAISFLVHGAGVHRLPGHARLRRSGAPGGWRRRRFPGDGIRRRHCVGADRPGRASDVLFALLRPLGCAGPFRPAVRVDATRSVDVRGARDRAGRLRGRASPARRFAVRCQRRDSAAAPGAHAGRAEGYFRGTVEHGPSVPIPTLTIRHADSDAPIRADHLDDSSSRQTRRSVDERHLP